MRNLREQEWGGPIYDDGRGRLPDRLKIPVPVGLREALKQTAESEGITAAEFARRAIIDQLVVARHRRGLAA